MRPSGFSGERAPARRGTDRYMAAGLIGVALLALLYGVNIVVVPEPFRWWHLLDAAVVWAVSVPIWWAGVGIAVHVRTGRRPPPRPPVLPARLERPDP